MGLQVVLFILEIERIKMGNQKTSEWTYRKFAQLLKRNGYVLARRSNGTSHHIFTNGKNTISINNHPNKMLVKRLIKENNLK